MSFRVCVVGCGRHSASVHGPSFRQYAQNHPEVTMAGCCDLDEARAEAYAQDFGFAKAYMDIDQMIRAEKPDAICLVAPVEYTCSLGIQLLAYGVPLIMEKPPGLNVEETDRLIDAAGSAPHMVAFNRRFVPLMTRGHALLNDLLPPADVHQIRYDFNRYGRADDDFSTTAIHGIDAVRFLARSDYRRLHFTYQEMPSFGPTVANIYVDGEMVCGTRVHMAFCPLSGSVLERAQIDAAGHTLMLKLPIWDCYDGFGELVHVVEGQVAEQIPGGEQGRGDTLHELSGFYGENAAFFDAIQAGTPLAPNLRESRQSVEIAQAIRERRTEYILVD